LSLRKMNENAKFYAGHRARLREKFARHKIMDCEVFELLLTYAIPRRDVKLIAKRLLAKYGTLHGVLVATQEELIEIDGVGFNTAIFIKAVYEAMIQDYKYYLNGKFVLMNQEILYKYSRLILADKSIEEFHVLYFDKYQRLIVDDLHSSGTSDATVVYPREILKRALNIVAEHVVLLHNHPDGSEFFSIQDIQLTMELRGILVSVGLSLFDHLLVCGDKVVSAMATNILR